MLAKGLRVIFGAALLASCSRTGLPTQSTANQQQGWVRVYFSNPDAPESAKWQGGPDEPLAAAIGDARLSIDVAAYDLDLFDIRDALIAAEGRGLQVRLVVEGDNANNDVIRQLAAAGILIVTDKKSDTMHDKFIIIDRYQVWTGSMNFTLSDAYGNRNNLVAISLTRLAQNYETEFNEMFLQRRFGPSSPADTPFPQLEVNGHLVETYFSPEDGILDHLIALVNGAPEEHLFSGLFLYIRRIDIGAARGAKPRPGGARRFGCRSGISNAGGDYETLRAAGIEVRLDGEGGSLHDKILVIDGQIVVTGSYNFSSNAEKNNDENTLVIHDAALAGKFVAEFWRIWQFTKE